MLRHIEQNVSALSAVFCSMPVAIVLARIEDQQLIFMNRKFTEIFGSKLDDFATFCEWMESCVPSPDQRELMWSLWEPAFAAAAIGEERTVESVELQVKGAGERLKTVLLTGQLLPETGWAIAAFVDITERKRGELLLQSAERRARESHSMYRQLMEHVQEMTVLSTFDRQRRYVSPAVQKLTGWTPDEYLALEGFEMIHPEDQSTVQRVIEKLKTNNLAHRLRYRVLTKDGSYRWVETSMTGYVDPDSGVRAGYVATVRDISEQKRREETLATEYRELAEVASLDDLTGIANRRTLNRTLEREALRRTRSTREISVLLLDVDFFKQYNDHYGHQAGDVCLKKIAAVMQGSIARSSDLAARFGGEEFLVLMPMTEVVGAETVAGRILRAVASLRIPHNDSPHGIVTVSIGVATSNAGVAFDQQELIRQADQALYQAKRSGRNTICTYDSRTSPRPGMDGRTAGG